jgi:hypothetical protein
MNDHCPRTTVSISTGTKNLLDRWRAPGQSYDGFLIQLISLWEHTRKDSTVYPKRKRLPASEH